MSAQPVYLSGRVHSVVFENESKAFYILRVALDAECVGGGVPPLVTVRGDIPGIRIRVGVWFGFEAVWDEHQTYGRQLKVVKAPVIRGGWDAATCAKVLAAQGIGPSIVDLLCEGFGEDIATALLDVERIAELPGMTRFAAEQIAEKWRYARGQFQGLEFLNDLGLPTGRVRQVWSLFGDRAQEILALNPWALVRIDGVTFEDADTVAERLNLPRSGDNPNRVEGAILYALRQRKGFGHLYLGTADLLGFVRGLDITMADRMIAEGVKRLVDAGDIILDRTTRPGVIALYDPWSYRIESESAAALSERRVTAKIDANTSARYVKSLLGSESQTPLLDAVAQSLDGFQQSSGFALSNLQRVAVINAMMEPVSIITGLPGSGKTTSLRMAVRLLQEAGVQPLLVAPTGIAAKRMSSVTGAPASTIHRAFGAKGGGDSEGREATYVGVVGSSPAADDREDEKDEVWGYGKGNPHPAEVVIVDESSMVDQHLLFRLLECTRPETRLVFVGDAAQLPSVGAGNVLHDLIESAMFPVVSLTEIFRQAETSPIIRAAHAIHRGELPELPASGSDFVLVPKSSAEDVRDYVLATAKRLYAARENFQILSPRHSGTVGVTMLNSRLRELLNPKVPGLNEVALGGEVLREDDRIIVSKNEYKLSVFNGDVGKVARIDRKKKEIEIKIHGPPVFQVAIPFKVAPMLLRMAYAITVHKAQGLEYDTIVIPVLSGFGAQLQRRLYYTAITRAKKRVILVGTPQALAQAVANTREDDRNTLLLDRLRLVSA